MNNQLIEVLFIEDDDADILLTKQQLQHMKVAINMSVVRDGVEAIRYLRQEGTYATAQRPDLILLDLNLPKKDGREVLQEIKNDDALKTIPVVVLTTSDAEEDILKSYNLGCNSYVTKPVGLKEFSSVVRSIEGFWLTIVKLPPRGDMQ